MLTKFIVTVVPPLVGVPCVGIRWDAAPSTYRMTEVIIAQPMTPTTAMTPSLTRGHQLRLRTSSCGCSSDGTRSRSSRVLKGTSIQKKVAHARRHRFSCGQLDFCAWHIETCARHAAVDRAVQRSRHRGGHDGKRTQHRERVRTDQVGLQTDRSDGEFGDTAAVQQDAEFSRGGTWPALHPAGDETDREL